MSKDKHEESLVRVTPSASDAKIPTHPITSPPVAPPVPTQPAATMVEKAKDLHASVDDNDPGDGGNHNDSDSDEHQRPRKRKKRPTFSQKVFISVILLATIPLIYGGGCSFRAYEQSVNREVQVGWELTKEVNLKPGPITFHYDKDKKALVHRGPMNEEDKKLLVLLIQNSNPPPQPDQSPAPSETDKANKASKANPAKPATVNSNSAREAALKEAALKEAASNEARQAALQSYQNAIGDLAYFANGSSPLLPLLLVAGLAGVIGAQLRSVSSFIYACRYDTLDVDLYWAWYLFRPLLGFVVGVIIVVLVKAGFVLSGEKSAPVDMWWLGLAIIVGFGVEGFTDKLYMLGKTIFGEGRREPTGGNSPNAGDGADKDKGAQQKTGAQPSKKK
jgi:hypothetical protein